MEDTTEAERIYGEHSLPIRRLLRVLVRDPAAAEDLTQETFLHFWQRPARFDSRRASLRAYLLGVARKKAAEWQRRQPVVCQPDEHQQIVETNQRVLITDTLHQLPGDLREILWLREVEGYSYQELADILQIPLGTVRSRLFSAREQLRLVWSKKKERL